MQRLSRRAFLSGAAGAGFALSAAGTLAACGGATPGAAGLSPALRPPQTESLTWPLKTTNPPVGSGLRPEAAATLRVLSLPSYLSPAVLTQFGRTYHCAVDVATFGTQAELLTRLRGGPRFDAVAGVTVTALADLVNEQLIQPLNHAYLTSQSGLWTVLRNPYYDQGARYTVPTGVYSTGLAWRKDKVAETPYSIANGWGFAWLPAYRGRVAILDDFRAGVGLGLLESGSVNLNTADPADLNRAQQALADLTGGKASRIDGAPVRSLASGRTWIHQATSAQVAGLAGRTLGGSPASAIGYWFPPSGYGPITCETGVVVREASSPVLAHAFLNFMLSLPNALANAVVNGRTPPLNDATPKLLVDRGTFPESLSSAVILQEALRRGLIELPLAQPANSLWLRTWKGVGGVV